MIVQSHPQKRKTFIIFIAIIASIILYMSGVISGLYANKLIKEATEQDINTLKKETAQELEILQNYIDYLDSNLNNMQLEQTFSETLTIDQMCEFSKISLDGLFKQLGYYWDKLPFRLEEYEKFNEPSEEYNLLKQQYAQVSIRTWILARNQYEKCDTDIVHGLYFYSADCDKCIEQGEQLDELNRKVIAQGKDIVMFPIDFYMNETIITNLKKYYGIQSTPAVIINNKVFQGRLFSSEELLEQ